MSSRLSTLQSFPYAGGLQAIKESTEFTDFETFYQHLLQNLPQNSPGTRKRYASMVIRWFFPERKLGGLLPTVWKVYGDEQLLQELMRATTLAVEPVIANFVTQVILPVEPGERFSAEFMRNYIVATYGAYKENSNKRLLITLRHLGFLIRNGSEWLVAAIPRPADALLLLLHSWLAPTPRIVRVSELLAEPFWRHLGIRHEDDVRHILRDAAAAGLLARYAVVDELEQITTRYTVEEYIANQSRL
jgi:hypothetical protein